MQPIKLGQDLLHEGEEGREKGGKRRKTNFHNYFLQVTYCLKCHYWEVPKTTFFTLLSNLSMPMNIDLGGFYWIQILAACTLTCMQSEYKSNNNYNNKKWYQLLYNTTEKSINSTLLHKWKVTCTEYPITRLPLNRTATIKHTPFYRQKSINILYGSMTHSVTYPVYGGYPIESCSDSTATKLYCHYQAHTLL